MSTISNTASGSPAIGGMVAALMAIGRRWREAYVNWCVERTAIALLNGMNERELRDIGLTRSEIGFAVRNGSARDRMIAP